MAPAACSSLCRSLFSTLWGVVVTVLAFSIDCLAQSSGWPTLYRVLVLLFYPVYSEYEAVSNVLKVKLSEEVWRRLKKKRIPSTRPEDVRCFRIIASCKIYVYVPDGMNDEMRPKLGPHLVGEGASLFTSTCAASIVREAMIVPGSPQDQHSSINEEKKLHMLKRSARVLQILIESDIVPAHYHNLKYVMARSTVGTILAVVQAAGYLLGILLRLAQKRAVSPVEAIASYYGVLVLLHLITHALWLTCSPQRPLLIYLDSSTWAKLSLSISENADKRQSDHEEAPSDDDPAHPVTSWFLPFLVAAVFVRALMLCLIAASSIRYIKNTPRCLLCGLAGLLFDLGLLLLVPALLKIDLNHTTPMPVSAASRILIYLSLLTIVSAFTVAVIATAKEWEVRFREPTIPLSQWIIPHIGS